ncbi:MAG: oxidative damage protection protein [Pseudomonadota bacterium]
MTRLVFCTRHRKELEGLDRPPFPGPAGQKIFETVSKQAWQEWLKHQTLLINEKRLALTDPATQQYLAAQRDRFLAGESVDRAEGYVPPKSPPPAG